jgi:hypothetical protein
MDPDQPAPVFDALHVPPAALEQGGVEVLRAVIVDGGLHVSLRHAFEDPDAWGMLLADVVRHVARIYAQGGSLSEDEVVDKVREIFDAELDMDEPSDPGTTTAIS